MQATEQKLRRPFAISFMGFGSNPKLWWDVKLPKGWLVIQAGRLRKPALPRIYWSPNATPWHHGARSIFRANRVGHDRDRCVCDECRPPVVREEDGHAD